MKVWESRRILAQRWNRHGISPNGPGILPFSCTASEGV